MKQKQTTNKVLEPLFDEWLRIEFPLVRPEGEHLKRLHKAFHVGVWIAMGCLKRSDRMPLHASVRMLRDMHGEVKAVLLEEHDKRILSKGGLE